MTACLSLLTLLLCFVVLSSITVVLLVATTPLRGASRLVLAMLPGNFPSYVDETLWQNDRVTSTQDVQAMLVFALCVVATVCVTLLVLAARIRNLVLNAHARHRRQLSQYALEEGREFEAEEEKFD